MRGRQTVRRERDRRVRRLMASAVVVVAVLVATTLGLAAITLRETRLSYRIDALRGGRQRLEELDRQLGVELATLRSPARIEREARVLGLRAPAREQVRLAREYVADGAGVALLQVAQTKPPGAAGVR
jgi:cell division protein FtsL